MAISSVEADFEIDQCDPEESGGERFRFLKSQDDDLVESHESGDGQRKVCIFIKLKDIYNVDYLSNVINLQFELAEHWSNVDLPRLPNEATNRILVQESNMNYIDTVYPNLVIEERDYNAFDNQAGNPIYQSKFKRPKPNAFRQYFYLSKKRVLIKSFKFNLQVRCVISMQNYPFIESLCKISLRASNPERNFNYSICNLSAFINRKFNFKKVGNLPCLIKHIRMIAAFIGCSHRHNSSLISITAIFSLSPIAVRSQSYLLKQAV